MGVTAKRSGETLNKPRQDKMDSYPSCATAIAMSVCRALILHKEIAPGVWPVKLA